MACASGLTQISSQAATAVGSGLSISIPRRSLPPASFGRGGLPTTKRHAPSQVTASTAFSSAASAGGKSSFSTTSHLPPSNTAGTPSGGSAITWPSFTSPSPRPPPTPSPRPRVPLSPRPSGGGAASAAASPSSRRRWRKGLLVANGLAALYGSASAVARATESTHPLSHIAPHLAPLMDHVPAEYASPIRFAAAALPFAPTAVSTFAAAAAGRLGDSVRSATTSAKGPLEPELESSLPVGGHLGPAEGRVSPPSEKEASSSVMTAEKVAEKAAEKAAVVTAGVELASYSFLGDLLSQFTDADSASTPLLLVLSLLLLPLLQFADRLHREATNGSSSSSGVGSGRTSRAPIVSALVAMVALVAASGASTGAGPSALLSGLGQSLPLSTPWPLLACLLSLVSLLRCEAHCTCFDPLSLTAVQTSSLASLSLFSSLLFHLLSSSSSSAFPHGILPIITDAAAAAAHAGPAVPSTAALLPLIYSGLMCSGLGTWMEMKCLQDMPAPALMLVFTSIPIWGGLLSALAQGEVPEIGLGVAGLVIAAVNAGAWAVMSRNGDGAASGHAEKASGSANSSGNSSSTVDSNGSYTPQNNMPGAEEDASVSKVPVEQVSNALVASQLKVPFYSAKAKSVLLKLKLKAKVAGAKVLGGKVGVKAVAASAYSASHALTSAVGSGSFGAGTADAAAAAAAAAAGGTVDALSSLGGGMEISSFVSSSNMPLVHHVPKVMLSVLPVAPDQLLSSVHLHDVLHVVPSSLHHFIH